MKCSADLVLEADLDCKVSPIYAPAFCYLKFMSTPTRLSACLWDGQTKEKQNPNKNFHQYLGWFSSADWCGSKKWKSQQHQKITPYLFKFLLVIEQHLFRWNYQKKYHLFTKHNPCLYSPRTCLAARTELRSIPLSSSGIRSIPLGGSEIWSIPLDNFTFVAYSLLFSAFSFKITCSFNSSSKKSLNASVPLLELTRVVWTETWECR